MTKAKRLSYDCALHGRDRPPIRLAIVADHSQGRYTVHDSDTDRIPHYFEVSVRSHGAVAVRTAVPWERRDKIREIVVGVNARIDT